MSESVLEARYGNKGVISQLINDIPINKDGNPVKLIMNYRSMFNRIPTEKPVILNNPDLRIGLCIDKLSDYFEYIDEQGYPLPGKSDIFFDRMVSNMDNPYIADVVSFIKIFDKSSLSKFDLYEEYYDKYEYRTYYEYIRAYATYHIMMELSDLVEKEGLYDE